MVERAESMAVMSEDVLVTPLEAAVDAEAKSEQSSDNSLQQPVVVYTAGSVEDGEIVRGLLESEGIPVIYTHAASPALGDVLGLAEGQAGEILVAPLDYEKAKALLAASTEAELPKD